MEGTKTTPLAIPAGFLDLVEGPPVVALTTVMPDGAPQTSVVWCDFDGIYVRINTMAGFRKEKNMRANPKVTLLCYDPCRPLRYLEIRGDVVEMTEEGAVEHLDGLSLRYTGAAPYFGKCIPEHFRETEMPILCRIAPRKVAARSWEKSGAATQVAAPAEVVAPAEPWAPEPVAAAAESAAELAAVEPGSAPEPEAPPVALPIPASHRDLLTRPIHGVLTTMGSDGRPQSSLVWVELLGETAVVNSTRERRKVRNLEADPRLSLLIVDPANTGRFIQIRGSAELREDGAEAQLDRVTRQYTPHPRYYGYVYPEQQREKETRVQISVHATRVTLDAIHA